MQKYNKILFTPSPEELRHERLISEYAYMYETLTENYDKTVCRMLNKRGIAIPTNEHERYLCEQSAKKILNIVMFLASKHGVFKEEIFSYIRMNK